MGDLSSANRKSGLIRLLTSRPQVPTDKVEANTFADGKKDMSHQAYRAGIARIAADEQAGDNVERDIANLARAARVSPDMIRHEVTELQD